MSKPDMLKPSSLVYSGLFCNGAAQCEPMSIGGDQVIKGYPMSYDIISNPLSTMSRYSFQTGF